MAVLFVTLGSVSELSQDYSGSAVCDTRLSDDSLDEEDPLSETLTTGWPPLHMWGGAHSGWGFICISSFTTHWTGNAYSFLETTSLDWQCIQLP